MVFLHHPVWICSKVWPELPDKVSLSMPSTAKWDDLRIFLEVARHGSVQAASKRLKLDHSTVTRRIGKLESLLAVKLLDRGQNGIVVREEAKPLLKHIEQMDMHAGSLEDAVT